MLIIHICCAELNSGEGGLRIFKIDFQQLNLRSLSLALDIKKALLCHKNFVEANSLQELYIEKTFKMASKIMKDSDYLLNNELCVSEIWP